MAIATDHELIAGYALNALDEPDQQRFEAHLAECTICATEVDSFVETAVAMAFALDDQTPPPSLRERLLTQVHKQATLAERPYRRLLPRPLAFAAGLAAFAAAAGFAVWTTTFPRDRPGETGQAGQALAAVLANLHAHTIALDGYAGKLIVTPSGQAVLVAEAFPRPDSGQHYAIWVSANRRRPHLAGLFTGGRSALILLSERVGKGAEVSVTREAHVVAIPNGPVVARTTGAA